MEEKRESLVDATAKWSRAGAQSQVLKAEAERTEVVGHFPLSDWPDLPLERYALGLPKAAPTFCYLLEFASQNIGSMKGGSARKLIVYRQKDGNWYFEKKYPNVEEAWRAVRAAFVQAFALADVSQFAAIDALEALSSGPALVTKALYIYYPDRLLPIFSTDHMRAFFSLLTDGRATTAATGVALNRQLFELVYALDEFRGWSPPEVMKFLYSWADPRGVVVKIAPGRDARFWDDCREGGYICVGWDEVGDLREYASEQDLRAAFSRFGLYDTPQKVSQKAGELWTLRELEPGDTVIANKGASRVLAVGRVVEPGYEWHPERAEHKHTVRVDWDTTKAREIEPVNTWKTRTVQPVSPGLYQRILSAPVVRREGKSWLFQANPELFDMDAALQRIKELTWEVNQHADEIRSGDQVFVWVSGGRAAGVRAVGAVMADPSVIEDDPAMVPFYRAPERFAGEHLRARVRIDQVVSPPLLRERILREPELRNLMVLRQPRGSNYALSDTEARSLRALIAGAAANYFILSARARQDGEGWSDEEGSHYRFDDTVTSSRALVQAGGGEFIYYRPVKGADEDTAGTFFGSGRITEVKTEQEEGGKKTYVATLDGFARFARPVPRTQGPDRWNPQHSITAISEATFRELVRRGSRKAGAFGQAEIRAAAAARHLVLPESLFAQLASALESGKNVVLTGAPGTGKTELALAVADAAQQAGRCDDFILTTATSDWTTFETIGGLRPRKDQTLEFHDGHFLLAIRRNHWLVIDELNRSNFDRAFGQLFTVLSGQPVVLPYEDPVEKMPIALVPEGTPAPSNCCVVPVPDDWRIIGTMNVFDKSLLFEMSFALMRRFAFIEVQVPSDSEYRLLVEREAEGNARASAVATSLLQLREVKELGPALFMDIARYALKRVAGDAHDSDVRYEAFYSYLLPQFEGIDDEAGGRLYRLLAPLVGASKAAKLRTVLKDVLGIELARMAEPAPKENEAEDGGNNSR